MSDLISRQAAIDELERGAWGKKWDKTLAKAMIESVPSAEPERKGGRWIEHNPHKWGLGIVFECSECGEKIECEPSNFCPNCGARMEE